LGEQQAELFKPTWASLWPSKNVSVCWTAASYDNSQYSTFRTELQRWVTEQISEGTGLAFTGWGRCSTSINGRVAITIKSLGSTWASIGWQGSSAPTIVEFGPSTWNGDWITRTGGGLHEMMHTLGFQHEFKRVENGGTKDCFASSVEAGNAYGTDYDHWSIMNSTYCGTWNQLSSWDRIGLRNAYGTNPNRKLASFLNPTPLGVQSVYTGAAGILFTKHPTLGTPGVLFGAPWNQATQIATINNADGRVEVVYIGTDGRIYRNRQTSPGGLWSGEARLGGSGTQPARRIALERNTDGLLELFYVGTDTVLRHTWQTTPGAGTWDAGEHIIPAQAKEIAVGANSDGRLELFYTSLGNTLYHVWQTSPGGAWSSPTLLLTSANQAFDLKVASNADGRLEVFYIGTDNRLYHTWQTSSGWSAEALLGSAAFARQIAVGRNADGRLEVFYTDLNNVLYHVWQVTAGNSTWSSHTFLQTAAHQAKQLSVVRRANGILEVHYVGTDDHLYRNFQTANGWAGEERL
jgi:hypothetical protein